MQTEIEILYSKQYDRSRVLHKKDLCKACDGGFRIDSKALLKGPKVDVKNIIRILNHTHDEL